MYLKTVKKLPVAKMCRKTVLERRECPINSPNLIRTVVFSAQSWKDQLQKAKDLYEQAKSATRRQTLLVRNSSRTYGSGELVMDVEYRHQQYVASRMVSRGSRMSSVTGGGGGGHSHSGSMDISGDSPQGGGTPNAAAPTSNSIRRNRSFEFRQQQQQQQLQQQQQHEGHRASSFSSDDGNVQQQQMQQPTNASTPSPLSPLKQQQSLPAQGSSYPASPRVERRLTTGGHAPNTLTVQIPLRQEHDDASSTTTAAAADAAAASIPTSSSFPCNSSSRSPADSPQWLSRSRSPGPRGITYPPPSPKSLKRGVAIQSSLSLKNPPMLKSRPVQQTIPVITGECNNYGDGHGYGKSVPLPQIDKSSD